MSISAFMQAAKETAKIVEVKELEDMPMADFFEALDQEDTQVTSKSVTNDQFIALRRTIEEYRKEIMVGNFIPTPYKLHTIVMWFRVSREEAFVAIKPKVVREKKPSTRTKKVVPTIGELM